MFHTLDLFFDQPFFRKNILILFLADQSDAVAFFAEPQIRVILTEQQTILGTACHHTVWLMVFFRYQIVDQNANIRLGTVEYQQFLTLDFQCRVDTRDQPLCGCLLVS